MPRLAQVRVLSLREQVVEQIRNAIIEGRFNPGDRITEARLTEELGVSRTPVREALILLEREGLILSTPNHGSMVRAFTERDVNEIFSMRTTLENLAGEFTMDKLEPSDFAALFDSIDLQKRAIQNSDFKRVRTIDMAFHRLLIERSEHRLLIRQWAELVAQIAAVLYLRAEAIPDYDEYQSINDHTAIAQAYQTHDLARLRALNTSINRRVASECQLGVMVRMKQVAERATSPEAK